MQTRHIVITTLVLVLMVAARIYVLEVYVPAVANQPPNSEFAEVVEPPATGWGQWEPEQLRVLIPFAIGGMAAEELILEYVPDYAAVLSWPPSVGGPE